MYLPNTSNWFKGTSWKSSCPSFLYYRLGSFKPARSFGSFITFSASCHIPSDLCILETSIPSWTRETNKKNSASFSFGGLRIWKKSGASVVVCLLRFLGGEKSPAAPKMNSATCGLKPKRRFRWMWMKHWHLRTMVTWWTQNCCC